MKIVAELNDERHIGKAGEWDVREIFIPRADSLPVSNLVADIANFLLTSYREMGCPDGALSIHVVPPGGHADPLGQSLIVGWKVRKS